MGLFDEFVVGGDEKKSTIDRIPEGEYKVTVLEREINMDTKRVGFNLHFASLGGPKGLRRWKSHSVRTQKAFDFLVRELKAVGLEVKSKDDVTKAIDQVVGMVAVVKVVNQKGSDKYQDFYFVRAEGRDRTVTDVHSTFSAASTVDDLPF